MNYLSSTDQNRLRAAFQVQDLSITILPNVIIVDKSKDLPEERIKKIFENAGFSPLPENKVGGNFAFRVLPSSDSKPVLAEWEMTSLIGIDKKRLREAFKVHNLSITFLPNFVVVENSKNLQREKIQKIVEEAGFHPQVSESKVGGNFTFKVIPEITKEKIESDDEEVFDWTGDYFNPFLRESRKKI